MSFISGVPHRPFLFLSIGNIFQMLSEVMPAIESPKTSSAYFKLEEYNIDYATGFFPQEPLPRLMGPFAIWEDALDDAEGKLSLGEDTRESAKARRPYGEAWRERVRKVTGYVPAEGGD
jgi:Indoleamine 2,3-dioxygenase